MRHAAHHHDIADSAPDSAPNSAAASGANSGQAESVQARSERVGAATFPAGHLDDGSIEGRFGWRSVGVLTSHTERVAADASAVADGIAPVLAAVATAEAAATPAAARAELAAELAAAAARLTHAAERLQIAAATVVAEQQAHRLDHDRTVRRWLSNHCGTSHGTASQWCRVAQVCRRFPGVGTAFWAGTITAAHADACSRMIPARFRGDDLARAVEQVRSIEDLVVETATNSTVDEFSDFCHRVRDRLDADGPADPATEPSKIWLHQTFNGRWALSGDLTPDDGAILATILADLRSRATAEPDTADGPAASEREREGRESEAAAIPALGDEHAALDLAQQRARQLIDALLAANGRGRPGRAGIYVHVDLDALHPPPPAGRAGPARSARPADRSVPADADPADADSADADSAHSADADGADDADGTDDADELGDPLDVRDRENQPERVDPVVADLLAGRRPAHTEAGLDVSDDTLWALLVGADVTPIFTSRGRSVSFGRTRRFAPPILQRVIAHRDRTCRFPGCHQPAMWTDAHHIVHWDDDGPTDPSNNACFCRHHHRVHHHGQFTISGDADEPLDIRLPDGERFDATPRYRRSRPGGPDGPDGPAGGIRGEPNRESGSEPESETGPESETDPESGSESGSAS